MTLTELAERLGKATEPSRLLLPRRSFLGWTAALVAVTASPVFSRPVWRPFFGVISTGSFHLGIDPADQRPVTVMSWVKDGRMVHMEWMA